MGNSRVRAGVPERVAMQMTGHKTRAVFERYNIVSPVDLRDAGRRLDRAEKAASYHRQRVQRKIHTRESKCRVFVRDLAINT